MSAFRCLQLIVVAIVHAILHTFFTPVSPPSPNVGEIVRSRLRGYGKLKRSATR